MKPRLLAALLSVAAAARANPFELYGFTPRATGMGGAMTAVGEDLGASFYNPAALLGHTRTELGLGFADTISNLWIHRARDGTAASGRHLKARPSPVLRRRQSLRCFRSISSPISFRSARWWLLSRCAPA